MKNLLMKMTKIHINFNKRNFAVKYPQKKIRVNKETFEPMEDFLETKSPEEIKYTSKLEINPDNIDDYQIIGAEIFKNSFKDQIINMGSNTGTSINTITEEVIDNEIYGPKVSEYKWQEPSKYYKHFTRRTFYDSSNPQYRHMFVPSYRYKVEPFNSIHTFRWDYIDGNREAHNEYIFKRDAYSDIFNPPFQINNPEVEDIITQLMDTRKKFNLDFNHPEFHKIINDIYKNPLDNENEGIVTYQKLMNKFVDIIPNLNIRILPTLLMKLFFEVSLNDKKFYITIEQEILNNLHHFSVSELSKINYVVTISSPKYTSFHFRSVLLDNIYKQVESKTLTLDELFSVSQGFRHNKNKLLFDKIAENLIDRKGEFLFEDKKIPSNLANIFYCWANNKPKDYGVRTFYPQKDLIERFIETYEDDLNVNISKMNQDDIWRLSTSLYLLRSDNVDPFINRIERNLLKISKDKLDPFAVHNILRAFSKMREGKMCGSDKLFNEFEEVVINHIENFKYSFQEFTNILYAYSVRASGSDKLYKVFNKKLNQDFAMANNYHMLHNIAWYYLFKENKNLDELRQLMKNFNELEGRLPIYYYRPFKILSYYLQHGFTPEELDIIGFDIIEDFRDRFFDPEQIYDYVKYERFAVKDPEFSSMKAMANGRLLLFPLTHFIYQNTFIIHFCWENKKMGINIWSERNQVQKSSRLNQQCLLHSKMMKLENWEILDINWEEFINLGSQIARDKFIYDWYQSTSTKQEKKGIFTKNLQFV